MASAPPTATVTNAAGEPLPPCEGKYYPTSLFVSIIFFILIVIDLAALIGLKWTLLWNNDKISTIFFILAVVMAILGVALPIAAFSKTRYETWQEVQCQTKPVLVTMNS